VRRGLVAREKERLRAENRSARSRLALQSVLARARQPVSLVAIHSWTRAMQGQAYLWATAFLLGREDLPPPQWVRDATDARSA
jgi:hypothetical protein